MSTQGWAFKSIAMAILISAMTVPPTQADQATNSAGTFAPSPLESEIFNGPGVTVSAGKDIYSTICAGCHMSDGAGAIGAGMYPALQGNEKLEYPEYAIFIVLNGYKAMPDFGHSLSDDQVAAVVNYLQSGLGNTYEPIATAEQVELSRPK